jgi:hypothetical protein
MKISQAIFKINPVAEFSYNEENIDTIQWHNGTTPIPKEQILAIIPQVELDMAFALLRQKRNALLAATDYLALSDQQMSEQMKAYRQQLRDLTEGLSTVEQVNSVVFPTKP